MAAPRSLWVWATTVGGTSTRPQKSHSMYSERALAPSMLTMPKRSGPTACTRVAICPLGLCKIAALRAACELPRAERDDANDVDILPPQKEQGYTSHVPQEGSWIREIFLTKPSYQVPGMRGPLCACLSKRSLE